MKPDTTIRIEDVRLNIRVGAIILVDGELLVCRLPNQDWWFVPGGRVKLLETSDEALKRELEEEIGSDFEILRPLATSENFFEIDGEDFHELCTYYLVDWLGEKHSEVMDTSEEIFRWMPVREVSDWNLCPDFLKTLITEPDGEFKLVKQRKGQQNGGHNSGSSAASIVTP